MDRFVPKRVSENSDELAKRPGNDTGVPKTESDANGTVANQQLQEVQDNAPESTSSGVMGREHHADVADTPPATNVDDCEQKVRGRPFAPGNRGRPRGSKNYLTRLGERLLAEDAEAIFKIFVSRALSGDSRILQLAVDRLMPRRRGAALQIDLPPIDSAADVVLAMKEIGRAVSAGEVSGEEANLLVSFVQSSAKFIEARDLEGRIADLEARVRRS